MGLKQIKAKQAESKAVNKRRRNVPSKDEGKQASEAPAKPITTTRRKGGIVPQRQTTQPKLSDEAKAIIARAETTQQVQEVLDEELPKGYTAIGKHDLPKLLKLKENIFKQGVTAFDYETNGDPEDEAQDPQEHRIVGVSFAYQVGQAFYLPLAHDAYGANWDTAWFVENFLKPVLEHPKTVIIAHNIQFEHQISMLYGIDMFPKLEHRLIIDTMIMLKMLCLPESVNTGTGEVILGLKPNTKALLADERGMVHGLIHVDDIKSFKDTVATMVEVGEYKTGKNKGKKKYEKRYRTFNQMPVDQEVIDYGCSDSDWALALYYKLLPILEAEGLMDTFFELNMPFSLVLGEYELTGWHASEERLKSLEAVAHKALYGENGTAEEPEEGSIEYALYDALVELTKEYTDLDENGDVIVPAGVYGMGKWRGEHVSLEIKSSKPFSWGSVQHKQWLFFHVLKLDTRNLKRSKTTGLPGTGADNYDKLVDGYTGDNKFMKIMKERAKYTKILSTYVNGMLPFLRKDTSKLHTKLKLVSTWRLSSSKPNLQNIPRADNDPMGIRSVFVAPTYDPKKDYSSLNICTRPTILLTREALSGHMFYANADYSQIELRVLAWYANERNMIQAFWDGHDFHSATAHDIFNLPCTIEEVKKLYKPNRYQAKSINFGLVYGLTEYGLSEDPKMNMTVAQAKQFIDRYFEKYPGVKDYANDQIAFAREHGYVQTIFGSRRPIPEINNPNKWIRQKGENKAMNTPIQGSASEVIKIAMVNIRKETAKPDKKFLKPVMQIHDEIQAEVPVEYALEGALLLRDIMERPIEGISDVIPIVAEPAVGYSWDTALDIKFDANGKAYVAPKKEKKEATDVTFEEVEPYLELYHMAGIEVRV